MPSFSQQRYTPPVLELVIQRALDEVSYSDFEDSFANLYHDDDNSEDQRRGLDFKLTLPRRASLLGSRWESERTLHEVDLLERKAGSQRAPISRRASVLNIPCRRLSSDSNSLSERTPCAKSCPTKASIIATSSKVCRRGSFTLDMVEEGGRKDQRGSFTMSVAMYEDDRSLKLDALLTKEGAKSNNTAPKRPSRRSSIVLILTDDDNEHSGAPPLADLMRTGSHARTASAQSPKYPFRRGSITLNFEDSASEAIPNNLTCRSSTSDAPKVLRRQGSDNHWEILPHAYQLPDVRLFPTMPKFTKDESQVSSSSPKLPRREESNELSFPELANIFDDDEHGYENEFDVRQTSAIEEEHVEIENNLSSSSKLNDPACQARRFESYLDETSSHFSILARSA